MLPGRVSSRLTRSPSGCLTWTGHVGTDGYGQVKVGGRVRPVHVVVWESLVGPVPAGYDVGHTCHDDDETCPGGPSCAHRACADLEHLALQTRSENTTAGRKARQQRGAHAAAATCAAGHPWTDENTYRRPDNGRRGCRRCRRAAGIRHAARVA